MKTNTIPLFKTLIYNEPKTVGHQLTNMLENLWFLGGEKFVISSSNNKKINTYTIESYELSNLEIMLKIALIFSVVVPLIVTVAKILNRHWEPTNLALLDKEEKIPLTPSLTPISTLSTFEILKEINKNWIEMLPVIHSYFCSHSIQIPTLSFTQSELKKIPELEEKITSLEENLKQKYSIDFKSLGWHGRLSQQRILYQNEEFLELISNPLALKYILYRENVELGGNNTLASLILFGLKDNLPAYLFTASPNWYKFPLAKGVKWQGAKLNGMGSSVPVPGTENPRVVTQSMALQFYFAVKGIRDGLNPIFPPLGSHQKANNLSLEEYLLTFNISDILLLNKKLLNHGIINERNINKVIQGQAASSRVSSLTKQSLGVMADYQNLLLTENGNHSKTLGYGLISHALDARHLAALCLYKKETEGDPLKEKGLENFNTLLNNIGEENIDSEARELMLIRFQQMALTVLKSLLGKKVTDATTLINLCEEVKKNSTFA